MSNPTGKKWYVIQAYSGYENKVKASLEERIKRFGRQRAATVRQPLSAPPASAEEANATD